VKRIDELKTKLPVILVGDFNAPAKDSKPYETVIAAGFTDAYLAAKERRGEDVGTFHNYRPAVPGGRRIDWILTRGEVTVDAAETVTFSKDDQFPSDHFPVAAWLRLPAKTEPLSAANSRVLQLPAAR
jgi:endonuclease/exonuclease/phosphatase family metal-dependent hydrolase